MKINCFAPVVKRVLVSVFALGLFTFSAQADLEVPPKGYHLGDLELGPGGKPPKPSAMFRHLIYNFQNTGFHNVETFADTAIDQIVAVYVQAGQFPSPDANQEVFNAAKTQLATKLKAAFFDKKGESGKTAAETLAGLYATMYKTFNQAFAPQLRLDIPVFASDSTIVVAKIDAKTGQKVEVDGLVLASAAFTNAQRLFRMSLLASRGFPNDYFSELRRHEPMFRLPGDLDPDTSLLDQKKLEMQKGAIRIERATYFVTRFEDIAYGYAYNLEDPEQSGYGDNWSPVAKSRQIPPYTDVIYSRAVTYFGQMQNVLGKSLNLMDYVTGGYLTGTWKFVAGVVGVDDGLNEKGQFMLGTKNSPVNEEKAYLHKIVNRVQDLNSAKGTLADRETSMNKVREVVAWYVKDAMKNKSGEHELDFARDISRHAAMGMVSDYFGFYPPDVNSQIQWSRNTQNSFFHNIFDIPWYDHMAFKSGEEMAAYISQVFAPAYDEQLANGRPSSDTVSMMISGHAKIPSLIKDAFEIDDQRIMTDTMGLLVGAGETTTMAANFALHEIMVQSAIRAKEGDLSFWIDFVTTAKKAAAGDKAAKTRFDAYVWEALRFKPVNPWTERMSDKEETVSTCTEPYLKLTAEGPLAVTSSCSDVTVTNGARVLFATQSAMFDPKMKLIGDSDPWEFKLDRGNENYIHFAFGYHRCLGDDVAEAMVPEIVMQVIANLNDIDLQASLASVNNPTNDDINPVDRDLMNSKQTVPVEPAFRAYVKAARNLDLPEVLTNESTPFPETFKIVYGSKSESVTRGEAPLASAFEYLKSLSTESSWSEEITFIVAYVNQTQALNAEDSRFSDRVLNNGLNRFNAKEFIENNLKLNDLELALLQSEEMGSEEACLKMQTDDSGDDSTRKKVCKESEKFKAFNVCYFLQRTGGQLSSKHAFNKCAYERNGLGKERLPGDSKDELLKLLAGKGDFYWTKYHQ